MSELPRGWISIPFEDAIEVISDNGNRIKQKDYLPSGMVPVIDQGEGLIGGYTNAVDAKIEANKPVIVFGDHTRRFKLARFPFAVGADGVKLFCANDCFVPEFMFHQLLSVELEDRGYGRHYQFLRKMELKLPPHAEQTRIVEKLEELLGSLDAAVAELKAAQRKLTHYRQSLLKAAMEGALTEAWRSSHSPCPRSGQGEVGRGSLLPSDKSTPPQPSPSPSAKGREQETGTQLLHRILQERRTRWEAKQQAKFAQTGKTPPKGWQAKYPEPVAPDTSELPALPGGWVWATIDQLAHVGTGVTPLRSKRAYFDGGSIPWTTSGALNDELVETASEHVTQLALEGCRLEIYPAGSLLVAMYGEGKTRGKCAELGFPSTINQAIAAIVFEGAAVAVRSHVKTVLLDAYEAMRKQASGGVQPNLNLQIIKAFPVPLPPLEEQTAILATLDTQLSAAKEQEAAITHALHQAAAQRRNLLRAAFSGQLVPQDPNDEPASALLARIRAARADNAKPAAATKRGRKSKGNT